MPRASSRRPTTRSSTRGTVSGTSNEADAHHGVTPTERPVTATPAATAPARDARRYPYNVDTVDPEVIDPKVWHQLGATRLGRGTTAYVLRTGRPIRFDIETLHELERAGEVEAAGTVVETGDWIGAPLTADGRTLGVIVVQSYTDEHHHDDADLGLLAF